MSGDLQREQPIVKSPRRRWRWVLVAAACLAVLVPVAWAGARVGGLMLTKNPPIARAVGNPLPVTAARVTRETITDVIGGTTLAQPLMSVAVNVAVTEGSIKAVRVELGKLVQRGEVLVQFDTDLFREALERGRLQVETARSELRKVEAEARTRSRELREVVATLRERIAYGRNAVETSGLTYQRLKTLWEQKVVAQVEVEAARVKWDEAKAALAGAQLELIRAENELGNEPIVTSALVEAARFKLGQAEQEVAQARKNMEHTVVRAPATGVIGQRTVDPGEWVKSGKTLFMLDLIDAVYAVAEVEQEKAPYVTLGQTADVVFDSHPAEVFRGPVAKIEPSIDPVKRTFKAFVRLANSKLALRPGMAGYTRISRSREMTVMPRLAVINPTGAPSVDASVFVVEDDRAVVRKVKLGKMEGLGRVEVLAGVNPGELVVVHGQKDLHPRDRVIARILEPNDKREATLEPAVGPAPRR